jgi:hypothetical protein
MRIGCMQISSDQRRSVVDNNATDMNAPNECCQNKAYCTSTCTHRTTGCVHAHHMIWGCVMLSRTRPGCERAARQSERAARQCERAARQSERAARHLAPVWKYRSRAGLPPPSPPCAVWCRCQEDGRTALYEESTQMPRSFCAL